MIDLEWNRKSIFEKFDWLKETLEDVIAKANHNVSAHQEQMRAIMARLSTLEKPVRKSAPRKSPPATKTRATKKRKRSPPRK